MRKLILPYSVMSIYIGIHLLYMRHVFERGDTDIGLINSAVMALFIFLFIKGYGVDLVKEFIKLFRKKPAPPSFEKWVPQPMPKLSKGGVNEDAELLSVSADADVAIAQPMRKIAQSILSNSAVLILEEDRVIYQDYADELGQTSLMLNAIFNDLRSVRQAIRDGVQINRVDNDGETALMKSVYADHPDVACELIGAGADVNVRSNAGVTAFLLAAVRGDVYMGKLLLTSGAKMVSDGMGRNALMSAASGEHLEFMQMLLDAGSSLDAVDAGGCTALIHAAEQGKQKAVALLTSVGANVNARTCYGGTALMFAASKGRIDIVRTLISAGADHSLACENTKTALDFAKEAGHEDVVAALRALQAPRQGLLQRQSRGVLAAA